ncbi:MAG: hypothetical protein I8H77_05245 [Comamonadaceae bacterium]|nr:hypothetical protein [Comamonadaceae bacterium]
MENSLQSRVDVGRRKRRSALWGKRLVGLAIVVSGGTLLAGELIRMVSAVSNPASVTATALSQ